MAEFEATHEFAREAVRTFGKADLPSLLRYRRLRHPTQPEEVRGGTGLRCRPPGGALDAANRIQWRVISRSLTGGT
ncbi:hypothetical protein GCM10010495_56890 [Kitasatospora herbaricolor]|uniref:hypothetical protein n=1 Tax=Kitasatospora herbaricolor TaxID=68217 RepID=UPI00174C4997|nr:hypothetical protein [Kitasatospora herbaricolor]MDQ0309914.1 hypothetical protein [Kitasatospora herbaricolor]GGV32714.1 hypothetical protein GCM10010495_56890 [Kitasatospora herbaricolor]